MLEPLEPLIRTLARLPGIGRRTAERIALRLVREPDRALARELAAALRGLDDAVRLCGRCGAVTTATEDPCRLCRDPRRDGQVICVVEDPADIEPIEKSGGFRGRYHALMGKLSPMRGESAGNPRFEALRQRVAAEGVTEVILALNTDVESDATAAFLREQLAPLGVRVTRLAVGLPAGSGIAWSDPVTLSAALRGRQPM